MAEAVAYFKVAIKSWLKKNERNEITPFSVTKTVGEALHPLIHDIDDEIISHVEAGDDRFRCDLGTPVSVLVTLGYKSLTVWLTAAATSTDINNNKATATVNAFSVLPNASRHYTSCPKPREEKNQKDVLFNKVIETLKRNEIGFLPIQVESTGKSVVTTLTTVLWYMDGRHQKFANRAVELPDTFKELRGYRSYKDSHKKVPEITVADLKENVDMLGELLLLPWILNPKFVKFKAAVQELLNGLQKYLSFLQSSLKRSTTNHFRSTPLKNLNERWVITIIESTKGEVDKAYEGLQDRMNNIKMYEPIDLCDLEPSDKEERRKWLGHMALSFPVTRFTYRYGNYLGNLNMIWKIPLDIRERKSSEECKLVQDRIFC